MNEDLTQSTENEIPTLVLPDKYQHQNTKDNYFSEIKEVYNNIVKHKVHFISILYTAAIIKSAIWYACFGVNTFAYISITDTFLSFFDYVVVLLPLVFCFLFFYILLSIFGVGKSCSSCLGIIFTGICAIMFFFIFRPIYSVIVLLYLAIMMWRDYKNKNYNMLISWGIIFLIGVSVFEPIVSYYTVTKGGFNKISIGSIDSTDKRNMDFFTFEYEDKLIDTSVDSLYPVGNTYNYFVIYNLKTDKTMIYPKSDCNNISIRPMQFLR